METIKESLGYLKKMWPQMRRTSSTAIVHSGGRQTIFGCLCGCRHTCSTNWRKAKHVLEWREKHKNCAVLLANKAQQGEEIQLSFGR